METNDYVVIAQTALHRHISLHSLQPAGYGIEHTSGQGCCEDAGPGQDACKVGRQFGMPPDFVPGRKRAGNMLDRSLGREGAGRQ